MANNERQPGSSAEKKVSFEQKELDAANERLKAQYERRAELEKASPEKATEARHEAFEQAKSAEKNPTERDTYKGRERSPAERRPKSKHQKEASFKRTMETVQAEMSAPSRAFSKLIHTKAVEKTSDAAAKTIARPNAILAGSIAAFACTLIVYLVAKRYGYTLSGFETMGAFIVGWLIGQLFDFLRVMITGRTS